MSMATDEPLPLPGGRSSRGISGSLSPNSIMISRAIRIFVAADDADDICAVAFASLGVDHKFNGLAGRNAHFIGIAGDLHHDNFIP